MKSRILSIAVAAIAAMFAPAMAVSPAADATQVSEHASKEKKVKKVLFIGDSMTGWLSERLNAYGQANGFEVATIVWDGSTFKKWGESPNLSKTIAEQNPDAVFVSLGMNELFEANPARFKGEVDKIREAVGNRHLIWVGPPSWPGQNKGEKLNDWLQGELGDKVFFRSFDLKLPRQGAKNPHPTRAGMIEWVDQLVDWIKTENALPIDLNAAPGASQMSRGKTFIYKRMSEKL